MAAARASGCLLPDGHIPDRDGGSPYLSVDDPGWSTRFDFGFPLMATGITSMRHSRPRSARPLRILIIEDYRDAAETMQVMLEASGHEVSIAYDGPTGIEVALRLRPDVVLCDIGLPGMDGHAVARALKRDPSLQRAHLIAISGYGRGEDQRRALEAGFERHLTKPVDPVFLEDLLASLSV